MRKTGHRATFDHVATADNVVTWGAAIARGVCAVPSCHWVDSGSTVNGATHLTAEGMRKHVAVRRAEVRTSVRRDLELYGS